MSPARKALGRVEHAPIAVVGMACRFPGAKNALEFWQLLVDKKIKITEMTEDRSNPLSPNLQNTNSTGGKLWWGKLDDIDKFDAAFFKISPREASLMDPQQRLALKVACEALEDAGLSMNRLNGERTGVVVAAINNEYQAIVQQQTKDVDALVATGGSRSALAGRISHALNFQGPSLTLDSDRSSGLVAVHLACQSLHLGESETVLVGGVNLILNPTLSKAFARSNMLAPDGKCKFGDREANGFVRAEGVAFLVLKSKEQALNDGDRIYAEICGSSVIHQGHGNHDIKVPVQKAQQLAILTACREAQIKPRDIQYIEAHGTGTPVGDSTELRAIGALMNEEPRSEPCLVGSVKTNIGHTEAAAGVAGLMKAALSLHYGLIPASLNFEEPSAGIDFSQLKIEIPKNAHTWPKEKKSRYAGVSSFGLTGTISHVILSEAGQSAKVPRKKKNLKPLRQILTISGESKSSLEQNIKNLSDFIGSQKDDKILPALCQVANTRRNHYSHRIAVIGSSLTELKQVLSHQIQGRSNANICEKLIDLDHSKAAFIISDAQGDIAEFTQELAKRFSLFADRKFSDSPTELDVHTSLLEIWREFGIVPSALIGLGRGADIAAKIAKLSESNRIPTCLITQPATDDAVAQLSQFISDLKLDVFVDPLFGLGHSTFLETTLQQNFHNCLQVSSYTKKEKNAEQAVLKNLGILHCYNFKVKWEALSDVTSEIISLPLYAWDEKSYWHTNFNPEAGAILPKEDENFLSVLNMSPSPARKEILRNMILHLAQTLLGPLSSKPLDPEESLLSQGFTDESVDELRSRLEQTLRRELPISLIRQCPTITHLTNYLSGLLGSESKSIGDILIANRVVSENELLESIGEKNKSTNERIGSVLLRKGLVTPEELRHALTSQIIEPIAIVGMAFRMRNGENDLRQLWSHLQNQDGSAESASQGFQFDSQLCPNPMPDPTDEQTVLLGVTWNALEHAGQNPVKLLASRTGVYFAVSRDSQNGESPACAEVVAACYGLCGPAIDLGGGESASLSAFHLACQSLRSGEIDTAIVGAAHFPSGLAKGAGSFSAFILKRHSKAVQNRDQILARISGSATTHSGLWQKIGGLTDIVQASAVREALDFTGLSEKQVSYVEMGDMRHVEVIQSVFLHHPIIGVTNEKFQDCGAVLGAFSVIKTILAFKNGVIAPAQPWPNDRKEKVAAIHLASKNGNTTHLLLKEPESSARREEEHRGTNILCLSAKDDRSLKALVGSYLQFLNDSEEIPLNDICYTAATGRPELAIRFAVAANNHHELSQKLKTALLPTQPKIAPLSAVLFADDNTILHSHWGELYAREPDFKSLIDLCIRTYAYLGGNESNLLEEILTGTDTLSDSALFTRHLAVYQLLRQWGVQPKVLVAGPRGELAAAHLAGMISLEDSFKLILGNEAQPPNLAPPQISIHVSDGKLVKSDLHGPIHQSSLNVDTVIAFAAPNGLLTGSGESILGGDGLFNALANLYRMGVPLNWSEFYRHRGARRTSVPLTPSLTGPATIHDLQTVSDSQVRNLLISRKNKAA